MNSEGKDKSRNKQRYSGEDSSNISKFEKEKGSGSLFKMSTCSKCGRSHYGKCIVSMDSYYGCGKYGHKITDCPVLKAKGREDNKVVPRILPNPLSEPNHIHP